MKSVTRSKFTQKSLLGYLRCLEELAHCIVLIREFPDFSSPGSLFPKINYVFPAPQSSDLFAHLREEITAQSSINPVNLSSSLLRYNDLVDCFDLIRQEAFYGRCIGYYLSKSAQHVFTVISSVMSGFADSFQGSKAGFSGFMNTVYRSFTSFLSPEERGRKIAEITRTADVNFCKNFWSMAENRILIQVPSLLFPKMTVSHFFALPASPIQLDVKSDSGDRKFCTITPPQALSSPSPVSLRVLSMVRRKGMEWLLKQKSILPESSLQISSSIAFSGSSQQCFPPSSNLLFHIHGGGFVALSAETHDVYLRYWAKALNCPIVSVNYSLAPEAPYPRALDECFYAFAWVMANRERLGARADARVVLCGDSAGGNLTMGVCLRAASLNLLEPPAGALVAYAPMLIAYAPSPSRMLSVCDPLLSTGILARCLLAYAGIDEHAYLASFDLDGDDSENTLSTSPSTTISRDIFNRIWLSFFADSPSLGETKDTPFAAQPCLSRLQSLTRHISVPSNLSHLQHRNQPLPRRQRTSCLERPSILPEDSFYSDDDTSSDNAIENEQRPKEALFTVDKKLQTIRRCPIPQDGFLSPYLASDEIFRRLPPLGIVSSRFDPFLDDSLELAKRADKLSIPVEVQILDNLPHAFLNFAFVDPHFNRGRDLCCELIARLFLGRIVSSPQPQSSTAGPDTST